jgi:hypothetical protein
MTRQQFEYAADRIERMLGLIGQPRAITFHTYEHNNDQHSLFVVKENLGFFHYSAIDRSLRLPLAFTESEE